MLYTVRNKCEEVPKLEYEDGLCFLYFNTAGEHGGSLELKSLLTYIQNSNSENVTNEVIKKLHDCLCQVKESPEVRAGYMMWEEKIFYERLDAKEEGKIEGKIDAIVEMIEEYGDFPEDLKEKMYLEKKLEKVNDWLRLAVKVSSIEEFIEKAKI